MTKSRTLAALSLLSGNQLVGIEPAIETATNPPAAPAIVAETALSVPETAVSTPPAPAKKPAKLTALEEAERLRAGERKCRAMTSGVHGEKRPCKKWAIKGGTVCPTHGGSAPQVKRKALARLNAMSEPAIIRLNELIHQSTHLPTALGAIVTVMKHTIGDGKKAETAKKGPTINIGIAMGGHLGARPDVKLLTAEVIEPEDDEQDAEEAALEFGDSIDADLGDDDDDTDA